MSYFISRERIIFTSGLVALLALIISGLYYLDHWKQIPAIQLPSLNCDLQEGPCSTTLPTGEVLELKVKQTHMPVLTNLQMDVKTRDLPVKKMYIEFKGAEMNMGEYRYELLPQKQHTVFTAQTILPTCIEDKMIWDAMLHVETPKTHYQMAFTIVNSRPSTHAHAHVCTHDDHSHH